MQGGRAAFARSNRHLSSPSAPFFRLNTLAARKPISYSSRPLTGSWSSGKLGRRYAYYRCPSCSRLSIAKDRLETLFLDLLDRLQPKPEYLQALRESVLEVWENRQTEVEEFKKIRQKRKLRIEERKQRLIEAFVYQQALDPETYRREMDRIREQECVTDVELHENRLDELDVEGVLAFAEHVVLNARRLWSEYDLKRRRQLQKVLFPSGLYFDGEGFGTPVTCLFFKDLEAETGAESQMVSPTGFEPVLPA